MKRLIAIFLSISQLSWAGNVAPPVQSKITCASASNSGTQVFTSGTTAGNYIVVMMAENNTTWTTTALSDLPGDTFTEVSASPVTSTNNRVRMYTAKTAGGAGTITITFSATGANCAAIAEYTNLASAGVVDCSIGGTGAATSMTTSNCTTGSAIDGLVGWGCQSVSANYTATGGYNSEQQNNATYSCIFEDMNTTSAGSKNATATSNSAVDYAMIMAALKNATQSTSGGGAQMMKYERYE